MKIVASVHVTLPFALDYCADGPDVPHLKCTLNGCDITVTFPPSMAEGTDGQSFFPSGWAWWKANSLYIDAEFEPAESDDEPAIRLRVERAIDEALRRLLNACRWRFQRAEIHPVRADRKAIEITLYRDDGTHALVAEPYDSYFFTRIPTNAPMESSISRITLTTLQDDIALANEPPLSDQLALDAQWLESVGEHERAERIRKLIGAE